MRTIIVGAAMFAALLLSPLSTAHAGDARATGATIGGIPLASFFRMTEAAEPTGICQDYWLLTDEKKREVLKLYQEYIPRFHDSQRKLWSAQVALEFAMIDGEKNREKLLGMADQLSDERKTLLRNRVEFRSRVQEASGIYVPLARDLVECLGLMNHGDGVRYPGEGEVPEEGQLPGFGGTIPKGGPQQPGVEKF